MGDGWQKRELARAMAANRDRISSDRIEIVLRNPAEEARLDDLICTELWPVVQRALRGTGLYAWTGSQKGVRDSIRGESHRYVTRRLTVMLADPERPTGPGTSPPWSCTVHFDLSTHGLWVIREAYLSFPGNMRWARLKKLLAEPKFQGNRPELFWESGNGIYADWLHMKFYGGIGQTWIPMDTDSAKLREEIVMAQRLGSLVESTEWSDAKVARLHDLAMWEMRGHARIAMTMDDLAEDWGSGARLDAVRSAVLDLYEAW